VNRQRSGLRKALLAALLLGTVYGVFQTEYPWRGERILTNVGLVIGCGFGFALLMAVIWSLTTLRMRAAALIWRRRR
jgi:hypothetical protein